VGVYTNLQISHDQVSQVIDDPRIKGVALTGSAEAGRSVAGRAGKNLKKSTMELGGSDAFIVLEDADLEKTVKWAVWAKMNNNGQCCIAAKRFIVVESIADRFFQQFQAAMVALRPGDPMDAATTLGPLSTEEALVKLLDQVKRAVAAGAKLVMGGQRIDRPGSFMQATILSDIAPGNPAFREELFGPVSLFFRVKDEDAAVALANDSELGLGGSVFTRDVARGKRVASRVDTGMVFVNHPTWTAPDLPFGGIKDSGYGRELSSMGIQEFVNKKLGIGKPTPTGGDAGARRAVPLASFGVPRARPAVSVGASQRPSKAVGVSSPGAGRAARRAGSRGGRSTRRLEHRGDRPSGCHDRERAQAPEAAGAFERVEGKRAREQRGPVETRGVHLARRPGRGGWRRMGPWQGVLHLAQG
jgi:Aldehyde dehydrogenase family